MKTEVIMKRELFGKEISQKSKTEFFSATDLVKAGNSKRMLENLSPFDLTAWFRQKNTIEFIKTLEEKYGVVKISGKGRGVHTWVHPFLFIDIALSISPDFKIEVYTWLYDHLLKYRNESGDSYKKMAGSIYLSIPNKSDYKDFLQETAKSIKKVIGASDWQSATEEQLKLRDKVQESISTLCDVIEPKEAVRITLAKIITQKEI